MQSKLTAEELKAVNEAKSLIHCKPKEAPMLLDSVISGFQASGKTVCALESRSWQCFAYLSILKYDEAKQSINLLVSEANQAGRIRFEGFAKLYLGIISAEGDEYEAALDYFEQALQIANDIDDLELTYRVYSSLAYAQIRFEQYEEALVTLDYCLQRAESARLAVDVSTTYFNIASAMTQLAIRELIDGNLTAERIFQVKNAIDVADTKNSDDNRLVPLINMLHAVYLGLSGTPELGLKQLQSLEEDALAGSLTERKAFWRAHCQLLEMVGQWKKLISVAKEFLTEMEQAHQFSALNLILRQIVRAYANIQDYKSAYEYLKRASGHSLHSPTGSRKERVQLASLQQDLEQNKFNQEVLRMRNRTLIERNKILEQEARYDPLSGLLNRRGTEEALQQFTERKFATRFLIALLDIDHFKRINDKFGHAIGDQVIHEFSNCLASSATNPAKIGRWGGEEFLIVYDVSDEHEMDTIGRKLVEEIRGLNWDHIHKGMVVTASVGLSMWSHGDSLDDAVRIADDMLYEVKHHGRDNWRSWTFDEAA